MAAPLTPLQAYPNILLTGAMLDQRVPFWHPLKYAARLRAPRTDQNECLVQIATVRLLGISLLLLTLPLGYRPLGRRWAATALRRPAAGIHVPARDCRRARNDEDEMSKIPKICVATAATAL